MTRKECKVKSDKKRIEIKRTILAIMQKTMEETKSFSQACKASNDWCDKKKREYPQEGQMITQAAVALVKELKEELDKNED